MSSELLLVVFGHGREDTVLVDLHFGRGRQETKYAAGCVRPTQPLGLQQGPAARGSFCLQLKVIILSNFLFVCLRACNCVVVHAQKS